MVGPGQRWAQCGHSREGSQTGTTNDKRLTLDTCAHVSNFLLQVIVSPYRLSVRDTINFGISRSSLRLAMEGLVASSAPINATPVIVATSASTDATVTTVCDWQVAPILHIRPGARRRRERDAFRHRDCTVIIHTYAACVQNHRQPHAYSDGRASRCPHVIREHRASSAGEVMCGRSANVLHITYVVHTARMRLAGCRWLTSGKPPRWHMCVTIVTILIVRLDRDYGPRPSVASPWSCL